MADSPVLLVDDDCDLREALRDALHDEGYVIHEAADGATALEYLRSHPRPSLILLDWNMAPMNGSQFMAEHGRDLALSSIPVILLTADVRAVQNVAQGGFAACFTKPLDLDALLEMVSRYCL